MIFCLHSFCFKFKIKKKDKKYEQKQHDRFRSKLI